GADELLVLRAELRAQAPHVDVDRPRPTVVVVAPDLLEELRPREDTTGVRGEALEELELLVREVDRLAAHLDGVAARVDDEVSRRDLLRVRPGATARTRTLDREPQPRLDLGG